MVQVTGRIKQCCRTQFKGAVKAKQCKETVQKVQAQCDAVVRSAAFAKASKNPQRSYVRLNILTGCRSSALHNPTEARAPRGKLDAKSRS